MMADPEVILLDEPFAGVNPALIERLIEITIELNRTRQKTFLLISHDIPSVMKLCKNLTVLSAGTTIAEGKSEDVLTPANLHEAYGIAVDVCYVREAGRRVCVPRFNGNGTFCEVEGSTH